LPDFPSCGSVFQKIEGVGAGRLVDQAGLKGRQLGGAQVSELHANYIINTGGATAANVLNLIELIQKEVKAQTGYELKTEISVIGER
jgi:UDP-N-acetylmuramate dehydrogenase